MYEVKPAVTFKQSKSSAGNSCRFRQMIQSYWRSIISNASTTSTHHLEAFETESNVTEDFRADPTLTNDIVSFVCNSEMTDVETLRRAISCQVTDFKRLSLLLTSNVFNWNL